jgi:putative transposase
MTLLRCASTRASLAGDPDCEFRLVLTWESQRVYQFSKSRRSTETRRVPQVRFGNLGLGVSMPSGLKRYYGKADLHFITFSCYRRLPLLKTVRARANDAKAAGLEESPCATWHVVMPEHVHLLISEPRQGTPSRALHKLKLRVSRKMRKRRRHGAAEQLRLPFEEGKEQPRAFWQARFYDFNVYSRGKMKEKLNYMHANAVIRKLVNHSGEWPWSSWSFYAKEEGPVRIDVVD